MSDKPEPQVLVVDDDPIVAELLQRMLRTQGCRGEWVGTAGAALKRLEQGGIDLVLLDVELPDETGVEALKRLRVTHSAIDLPVIMVTGHNSSESVVEALRESANDYVTKPVDLPVLMARVRTQLTLRDLHARVRDSHRSLIQAARMESALHLAGGFAQEIRRPLAKVRSGLNGMKSRLADADEEGATLLGGIDGALAEADGVVSRLVASSSNSRLRLEPTDIFGLCEEILRVMRETAGESGVEMELKTVERHPFALVSPPELKQVFLNAALNAIRASGKGGRVVVRVLEQRVPGNADLESSRMGGRLRAGDRAVVIEIEDAGQGLMEEELQRVYDPFFKGRCAGPGAGLGLTLARHLMELHGGLFTLENRAFGSGAKASLYLRPKPEVRV